MGACPGSFGHQFFGKVRSFEVNVTVFISGFFHLFFRDGKKCNFKNIKEMSLGVIAWLLTECAQFHICPPYIYVHQGKVLASCHCSSLLACHGGCMCPSGHRSHLEGVAQ